MVNIIYYVVINIIYIMYVSILEIITMFRMKPIIFKNMILIISYNKI